MGSGEITSLYASAVKIYLLSTLDLFQNSYWFSLHKKNLIGSPEMCKYSLGRSFSLC
jgi:hypothetical protein